MLLRSEERTLVSSLPELRAAAERLKSLITDTRQYTGAVSLDISHVWMASRTAEGFYKTLINGADYLCDCFVHIGEDDRLDLVKVKTREQSNLLGIFQASDNCSISLYFSSGHIRSRSQPKC